MDVDFDIVPRPRQKDKKYDQLENMIYFSLEFLTFTFEGHQYPVPFRISAGMIWNSYVLIKYWE